MREGNDFRLFEAVISFLLLLLLLLLLTLLSVLILIPSFSLDRLSSLCGRWTSSPSRGNAIGLLGSVGQGSVGYGEAGGRSVCGVGAQDGGVSPSRLVLIRRVTLLELRGVEVYEALASSRGLGWQSNDPLSARITRITFIKYSTSSPSPLRRSGLTTT